MEAKFNPRRLSSTEIAQMFCDYVTRMEDMPRHTKAAQKETEAFDRFCESEFPRNIRLQVQLCDRMMNAAVEYEESGFIAGFQTAAALFLGDEDLLPVPTCASCMKNGGKAQEQATKAYPNNSTLNPEKGSLEASNESGGICKAKEYSSIAEFHRNPPKEATFVMDDEHITSLQIAEMFGTTNTKVIRRIEAQILPYIGDDAKKHFIRVEGYNIQHKKCTFYRLDSVACHMYVKEIEPKKGTFVNIAGGCAKMQELMNRMFPAEKTLLPA